MEKLIIAGKEFESRLFLGTGKFNSNQLMEEAILASGTEMVTVAMKRIELDNKEDDMLKLGDIFCLLFKAIRDYFSVGSFSKSMKASVRASI